MKAPHLSALLAGTSLATPRFPALRTGPTAFGQKRVPEIVTTTKTIAIFLMGILFSLAPPAQAADTFATTGSLATARYNHTATLLPSGKVLVAGGFVGQFSIASAEIYDPATGTWAATGSLATSRGYHTATLLPNGKVLVAGGYSGNPFGGLFSIASAELYDPATGTWSATGSLATQRREHTATLLPNGKLLVAGGYNGSFPASAELYDPATGTWAVTGSLATARRAHTATLLPNGKVLVAGGFGDSGYLSSAELYDPATGTWTAIASLATSRYLHTATLLPNGKLLVVGGANGSIGWLAIAELYDPATGTWTATGSLATARVYHTATLLPNGKVLVTGGAYNDSLASAELYDPATGNWTTTGTLATARNQHTATLLPNGKLLVAAGGNGSALSSAELYDSASGFWAATGFLATSRYFHTASLLPNGKLLVAGGLSGNSFLASAELYDPAAGIWTVTGSLATARYLHTATLLPNGKLLVAGGYDNSGSPLASAELYDPATGTWAATGSLATARREHTATLLPCGKLLVAGGQNNGLVLASAELYDPAIGTWVATGSLTTARGYHTATLLPNGKLLVAGGTSNSGNLANAELYDPTTGIWTATGSLATARFYHTATLLPNGKLLVAGGYNSGWLASAELYDPATGTWGATGSLATARYGHTASLLPNGKLLVAGGSGNSGWLANAELFDPATGFWDATGSLANARYFHTTTLLPSGKLLDAGGYNNSDGSLSSAELYDVGLGFSPAWQPQITTASFNSSGKLALAGTSFRGISSASGGNGALDSPSNYPVVQLRRLDNEQSVFLLSDAVTSVSATSFTSVPVTSLQAGYALATVFSNGIPSPAAIVALPNTDIAVEQPLGSILTDGTASIVFGSVVLGSSSAPNTFTITNPGNTDLTISAITKDGTNPGDFTVNTSGMVTTITPGNSTIFSVIFSPTASSSRSAAIHIASNVSGAKNPFDIALSGVGSTTLAPTFATPGTIPITSNGYTATGFTLGTVTLGFAPVPAQALTLVNNTSGLAITGTFTNLAQGDTLVLTYGGQSYIFTADYSGGDGNDLVLTANNPPTFTGRSLSTPFQTATSISFGMLLSQAADADGDALVVTAAGPSAAPGGSAVLLAGSILYTPPAGFSGIDTFPVTITDAPGDSVIGLVTVTVGAPNPSGGASQSVRKFNDSVSSGGARSSTLIAAQTYLIVSSVGDLAAAPGSAGSLSVGSGFVATLSTQLPTNTPPTFAGYSLSTPYQTTASISLGKLKLQAADADGDAVSVSTAGSTTSQSGMVAMQGSSILYTPPSGFSGTDTFPVTVTDARGAYIIGSVVVTVQANTGVGLNSPLLTKLSGGRMGLAFQGIPGRPYEIQRSTDLMDWQVLTTVTASPANGAVSFIDESPPVPNGYYRLRKP